jgi:quercetin dioxygenase-like cupin family protein
VIPEAPLERTPEGLVPRGEGWFVVNAREARWRHTDRFGSDTPFEGDVRFPEIGINVGVLQPGQPNAYYHGEESQENFLVLSGECLLLVEGEERRLRPWDFVHLPPWTEHILVGAGSARVSSSPWGPAARTRGRPLSGLRRRPAPRAGVAVETSSAAEAYADVPRPARGPYRPGTLPDL